MKQIIQALMYIHSNKFIHRDIKPANILLFGNKENEDEQHVKLTDFGIGRNFDTMVPLQTVAGTPGYMAPELIIKKVLKDGVTEYS